ncbi:MAG: TonB-dependent receptor [Bryobacteraceae bacterium]
MPIRVLALFLSLSGSVFAAQSPGNAGTLEGVVTDPSGLAVPGAEVSISNPVSGFKRQATTDAEGTYSFRNLPQNAYHMEIHKSGFADVVSDVNVRSSVPVSIKTALTLAGERTTVNVESETSDLLDAVPSAHVDIDQSLTSKMVTTSPGSGLSDAITRSSPGVVADSNGFFHPIGDHAQTSFSVDNQPINDQQSKAFSTQLPLNAIQSMELITSSPNAEFGDKTSLVVSAVTRSGLAADKPFGKLAFGYSSFGTVTEEASIGFGGKRFGNFLAANATRSGRFLDTPEFMPIHAAGNNETVFDRFDWQPGARDTMHLNLFLARNWFQVPNTYDQPSQDQRQLTRTFNISPGWVHTFGSSILLTINPFLRQDQVNYYPSRDPFADAPATVSEKRRLRNFGARSDLSIVKGKHNFKTGIQVMRTQLKEGLSFGVTDAEFNAVCANAAGDAVTDPSLLDPGACAGKGYTANGDFLPGILPYDLTRGGAQLNFSGRANIDQFAWYAQDSITLHALTLNAGLRIDHYSGLTSASGVQPRLGAAYLLKRTNTVLRAAYTRAFETPYNENLILSGSTGSGGLASGDFGGFGAKPLEPGRRNQYNAGLQQSIGKHVVVDADYIWKYTDNAYDFGTLFNTPLTFPISWNKSKIDGVSVRVNLTKIHGFSAYTVMGHTRSRFFGPSNGGLIFNSPLETEVFRIDHDQAFQQTTNVRYEAPKTTPFGRYQPWIGFTWRYDSGLVAGSVPDLNTALSLTAAQQSAIGFFCGGQFATPAGGISSCSSSNYGATRLVIPKAGTYDADHNPPRVAPRHLLDVAVGTDNLLKGERYKVSLRLSATNLTNNVALFNFLSTFSGTHFVAPRSYQAELGFTF